MKILVIPSWHPTQERKSWCTWVKPHIEALKKSGHDVFVLHIDIDSNICERVEYDRDSKYFYRSLKSINRKFGRTLLPYFIKLKRYSNFLINDFEKYVLNDWGRPDVIHAHVSMPAGFGAVCLGEKYNIPTAVTEHYSGFINDAKYFWRLGLLHRYMLNRLSGFYCVSESFKANIETSLGYKVSGVIENPVDFSVFNLKESDSEPHGLMLVSTGSVGALKGTDTILKATDYFDFEVDWSLRIYGDLSRLSNYASLIGTLKHADRIEFCGSVEQDQLAKSYNESDIYIVSSRKETANVSMFEAMACGCYVVSTRCGGPESLLPAEHSSLINVGDPEALGNVINNYVKLMTNSSRQARSNYVRDKLSLQAIGNKMSELFNQF